MANLEDNIVALDRFMGDRGWTRRECVSCGNAYYSKPSNTGTACNRGACNISGVMSFSKLSHRRQLVSPVEVWNEIRRLTENQGFHLVDPLRIANDSGRTDLVIAGVQALDPVIHQGMDVPHERMVIAQPSVRMKFLELVPNHEGTSTSFVNVCTEMMGQGIEAHFDAIDLWLSVLSKLGMNMRDFVLMQRVKERNWGTGSFETLELFFLYGDLELGDAAHMHIPRMGQQSLEVSDIGFGLERIVWALNKLPSYFDALIPMSILRTKQEHDTYRTLALLALSGVTASNKGAGLQLRRLCGVIAQKHYDPLGLQLIGSYFDYWAQFVSPVVNKEESIALVRAEVERLIMLEVGNMLNIPPRKGELLEAYMHRLVYTAGVSITDVRSVLAVVCKPK